MERFSFVKNGVLSLPPGFRFHPTDQELVLQYLRRKVYDCPLPASVIPEFDVYRSDPWDLPGDREGERYYLSTKEAKYPNGNRANRATVSGYWKATGIDKPVLATGDESRNHVVGMKKTLVFYRGKPPRGSKTDWIMHEYRLADAPSQGNWVLCRIFLKRKTMIDNTFRINNDINLNLNYRGKDDRRRVVGRPVFYDFMSSSGEDKSSSGRSNSNAVAQSVSSSSGGSSGVTEVSSFPGDEDSSCSNPPDLGFEVAGDYCLH